MNFVTSVRLQISWKCFCN